MDIATAVHLTGYATESKQIPTVSDGGGGILPTPAYSIPPAIWPLIFLAVGYVGLRLLLED